VILLQANTCKNLKANLIFRVMKILLNDRVVIEVSGADSAKLLQGIITNNVALLESQPAIFSALLSPVGKFLHDFFVVKFGDKLLLDVEARQAEDLIATLTKYRLRAKVTFKILPDWRVYSLQSPLNAASDEVLFADVRHPDMGLRLLSAKEYVSDANLDDYHYMRINCALPEGLHDLIYDKSYLLENNYDLIHAIDFNKGCYVGQEVTARSKYRGVVRKKIYKVRSINGEDLPSGTNVQTSDGVILGEMRSCVNDVGLAQLRVEELQAAQQSGSTIFCDNTALYINFPK
jgi:folate-binding protein YgfZ